MDDVKRTYFARDLSMSPRERKKQNRIIRASLKRDLQRELKRLDRTTPTLYIE